MLLLHMAITIFIQAYFCALVRCLSFVYSLILVNFPRSKKWKQQISQNEMIVLFCSLLNFDINFWWRGWMNVDSIITIDILVCWNACHILFVVRSSIKNTFSMIKICKWKMVKCQSTHKNLSIECTFQNWWYNYLNSFIAI